MKITDPSAFAKDPPNHLRGALVYGPNAALIAETIAALRKTLLPGTADDFSFVVIQPEDFKNNPSILGDELSALGFFAAKKIILVKNASDTMGRAAQEALDLPDAGHFLILQADELTPKSTLRVFAEKSDVFASVPCYALEGATLNRFITTQFQKFNATITNDALNRLADRLGGDMIALPNIVQQLITYVGSAKVQVTTEHIDALLVDQAEQDLDHAVQAFADGNFAALDRALQAIHTSSATMIGVLRALQSYFYRLRIVHAAVKNGDSTDTALGKLRPPVFFKAKTAFTRHLRNWPLARVDRALAMFLYLESQCKKTGTPDLALVQQRLIALMQPRSSSAAVA
jgi:DNA polymerase III subunit delta